MNTKILKIIALNLVASYRTLLSVESLSPTVAKSNVPTFLRIGKSVSSVHLSGVTDGEDNGCEVDVGDAREPPKKKAKLRFGGKRRYRSEELLPLPVDDIQSLHRFFAVRGNQHVLLTGGKAGSEIQEISLHDRLDPDTIAILDRWNKNALFMGGDEPNSAEDTVVKVTPLSISISAVKVCPETMIGSKLVSVPMMLDDTPSVGSPKIVMPEYQAVLIQDYPRASGPKALVWLFNKMIYGGKPIGDLMNNYVESSSRNEKALLRVWAEPSVNGTFFFAAEAEIRLEFSFPRLLLRFFPMNKEKAEEICNNAMVKALDLNLSPAIDMFTELYMDQMNIERHERGNID